MAKEKRLNGNIISRRFSTMLPLDVFVGLTNFAKQHTQTGLGKFDYGVALRILLNGNNFAERLDDLEQYIAEVEAKTQQPKPESKPEPVKEEGPKTFGTKLKEVNKWNLISMAVKYRSQLLMKS